MYFIQFYLKIFMKKSIPQKEVVYSKIVNESVQNAGTLGEQFWAKFIDLDKVTEAMFI